MPMIDADALMTELNDTKYAWQDYDAVEDALRNIPTIEAEPVRHGYWENANGRPKTYIRKCSVCGKEAYFCGRGCSYKFCPNCGATMDGDSDE